MTPKQRVLKKWPVAHCVQFYNGQWGVFKNADHNKPVIADSPHAAWADAAKRLEAK